MGAVEELDSAILFPTVPAVERKQIIAHAFHAGGRSEIVPAAVHAQPGTRNNQLVDLGSLKMFEQRGNVVIDPVSFQVAGLDQLLKIRQAADVEAKPDTRKEKLA